MVTSTILHNWKNTKSSEDIMTQKFINWLTEGEKKLAASGLLKQERVIQSPQQTELTLANGKTVLNFCANNYLGFSNHPALIQAASQALDQYGFGLSSVRFICGTQNIHLSLENKLSSFLNTQASILFSSCFDANTGLFETLLTKEDAIISDELNHASIIDGIRLCKAQRFRYQNNNMQSLEEQLQKAENARFKLIATDGVFSMNGTLANLPEIVALAKKYQAEIMVDDSHATGVIGPNGRGTPEHFGVCDDIDIVTGTLGKALGGASGGYVSGRQEIINCLRQRARPYLFSNSLAPMITATALKSISLLEQQGEELLATLKQNTSLFRQKLTAAGFNLIPGEHPIVPIMLGDAKISARMAEMLLEQDIYVISFSYPVVPLDQARIRVQICATHTTEQINKAVNAFCEIGKLLDIIN